MKKTAVMISLLACWMLLPDISYSRGMAAHELTRLDTRAIRDMKERLSQTAGQLSILAETLKEIRLSMDSGRARERYAIKNCRERLEKIEKIYRYVVQVVLDKLLTVQPSRAGYYGYLQENTLEDMERLVGRYLSEIQRLSAKVTEKGARRVLDQALSALNASSGLVSEAVELVRQNSQERKAGHQVESPAASFHGHEG
ncbi:MAG: hypothetical protein JRI36_02190 [Deltaproteobacteria bacterium]|nr:hypothetical protein [Deltaproteobacteria bacterium]